MRRQTSSSTRRAIWAATFVLATGACNLNKQEIPDLIGPAELAIALQLEARPDVLTADGTSTSAIQVRAFNHIGQPLSGQAIFFAVANLSGQFVDIGKLSNNTAVTNGSGVAQVIYTTPPRTDSTINRTIQIVVRPISGDAAGQLYRAVRIELRSAEPRLFPGSGCNFVVEPGTLVANLGQDFLFQSTSSQDTVRYEWDLGDGTTDDKPDIVHRYGFPGSYTVTHVVTFANGGQAQCQKDVTVLP